MAVHMAVHSFNEQSGRPAVPIQVNTIQQIEITGKDAFKFLQSQITCDLSLASWQTWLSGGYCDPKGKLIATFWILGQDERFLIFIHKDSLPLALEQFKKFSIFNQVQFNTHEGPMLAYWGVDPAKKFNLDFQPTQNAFVNHEALVLKLSKSLVLSYGFEIPRQANPNAWWEAALLEQGWIQVPQSLAGEYIPQMLNLDLNGGISYKKGCYLGQEIVARTHFKGQTKRVTRVYQGQAEQLPKAGEIIEKKTGENWRRAGAVLSSVRYDSGVVALYAVGPIEDDPNRLFRIQGQDDSQFTLCPLIKWNPNHE